jgi:hypothetical protein
MAQARGSAERLGVGMHPIEGRRWLEAVQPAAFQKSCV